MVSGSERNERTPPLPEWLPWLQLGVTTMLAVLFLVMLAKGRELNRSLRQLEQRVQGLENTRALDRTTAMEQQLRSMLQRLQKLEAEGVRLQAVEGQQQQLEQELLQLRGRSAGLIPIPEVPAVRPPQSVTPSPPPPPVPAAPPLRQGTSVIRPPSGGGL
jgi:TolA-binding protein